MQCLTECSEMGLLNLGQNLGNELTLGAPNEEERRDLLFITQRDGRPFGVAQKPGLARLGYSWRRRWGDSSPGDVLMDGDHRRWVRDGVVGRMGAAEVARRWLPNLGVWGGEL